MEVDSLYSLPSEQRILIHCDLDAFFAAVEVLHHGFDDSIPLIIGSDPKQGRGRGIVSTCNYAARAYGIRSAMPISEAWRRCPAAPFGPARYISGTRGLYSRASRKVMSILREEADVFEQASIDEAYLDVTEKIGGDWDQALALARTMQQAIMDEVGLSASFGIGPTRILAKMSSEVRKPFGIFRVLPDEILQFFEGRSLREILGVGPKRSTQMAEWGLENADEAYAWGRDVVGGRRWAEFLLKHFGTPDGTTAGEDAFKHIPEGLAIAQGCSSIAELKGTSICSYMLLRNWVLLHLVFPDSLWAEKLAKNPKRIDGWYERGL